MTRPNMLATIIAAGLIIAALALLLRLFNAREKVPTDE
jgi:hypothetical protein